MPVNIVNNTDAIKRQDNITPIEVLLTDDNNANYPIDGKTVKAWFSNETGFLYEKELTERDGQKLIIRIDPDEVNKIGIGKIKMEIVVEESDRQKIFPNGSYIEFEIVRNLKSINGTVLNPITLEFFEQEFEDLKLVADAATKRANDAADRVEALEPQLQELDSIAEKAETAATNAQEAADSANVAYEGITDIAVNPINYGVVADGVTDDTVAIQSVFDRFGGKRIEWPSTATPNITSPVFVRTPYTRINWNGAKLLYSGIASLGADNGINRRFCAVNIEGKELTETKTTITAIQTNIPTDLSTNTTGHASLVTTSLSNAGSIFSVGDMIYIEAYNFTTWGTWSTDHTDNPAMLRSTAVILKVSGSNVMLDINPEFVFGGAQFNGSITKMQPIEGVEVTGFNFEDANPTPVPSNPTNAERESWVGGIRFYAAKNFKLETTKVRRQRFPGIIINKCHSYWINGLQAHDAKIVTAGCGYGIQAGASVFGTYDVGYGSSIRHLIDHSGGGHHVIRRFRMPDADKLAFDCHGMGEFDIRYEDCEGNFLISNGITEFPEMVTDVILERCKGKIDIGWCKSLEILNPIDMKILERRRTNKVPKIKIKGGKVSGAETILSFWASTRGAYNDTYMLFNPDEFEITNKQIASSADAMLIEGYEILEFADIKYMRNYTSKDLNVRLQRCKHVIITAKIIKDLGFQLTNVSLAGVFVSDTRMENGSLHVKGVTFLETLGNAALRAFINMANGIDITNYKVVTSDNSFTAVSASRWMRFGSNITKGAFDITADGNTMGANIEELNIPTDNLRKSNNNTKKMAVVSVLSERNAEGVVTVGAGASNVDITFKDAHVQNDGNYGILLEPGWPAGGTYALHSSKTKTGFRASWATPPGSASNLTYKITEL